MRKHQVRKKSKSDKRPDRSGLLRIARFWDRAAALSTSRTATLIAFLFLLAAVFVRYATPLTDPDLWWHMKLGEYMINNLTLKPDHSIYSWTIADPNWVYNGWIPEIFFHLLYSIGGVTALHLSNYLFLAALIGLFLYFNRTVSEPLNPLYILMFLLAMVWLHLNANLLKPEIFSVVFLTLTVFIYFYSLSRGRYIFWLYPALMLLWVNSHGVFIFGIAFISVALAGEWLNRIFKRQGLSKAGLKNLLISTFLSYAVLIITPYGPKWLWSIITSFTDPRFMAQAKELIAYKPIFDFYHPAKYILIGAAVSYFIISIYMLIVKRYFNISLLLMNAVFIYFSLMYARSAYFYIPVWYFSMAYLLSLSGATQRLSKLAPVFLLLLAISALWTIHWAIYYPQRYQYFGFGVGEGMPEKTTDFLLRYKPEGPIFNTYEIGGYLLWRLYPDYRVFIDPRHRPYSKHLADEYRQFELGNNFEGFTAKYPFKTAIVKLTWLVLVRNFFKSPDWRLVYFDTSAALFVHRSVRLPDPPPDLGPYRFKGVKSYESLVHIMYVYLNMEDFKSANYIMDLIEAKYNYGRFKETIAITRSKLIDYEKRKGEVQP